MNQELREALARIERKLDRLLGTPDQPAHEPAPRVGYPVFDALTREVMPGETPSPHPLYSDCGCGQPILLLKEGARWQHCG